MITQSDAKASEIVATCQAEARRDGTIHKILLALYEYNCPTLDLKAVFYRQVASATVEFRTLFVFYVLQSPPTVSAGKFTFKRLIELAGTSGKKALELQEAREAQLTLYGANHERLGDEMTEGETSFSVGIRPPASAVIIVPGGWRVNFGRQLA